MGETHQEGSGAGADFDLTQFYQIFFEEAGENLDQMEHILLDLDLSSANDEELNGIFRCAHSIKGGAATFGFSDVAELTHHMESLLDRLRRHEIQPIPQMVDVLLESADASRSLLARHQAGGEGEGIATTELVCRISELAAGVAVNAKPVAQVVPVSAPAPAPAPAPVVPSKAPVVKATSTAPGMRQIQVRIGPLEQIEQADAIKELFRDIPGLGTITDLPSEQEKTRIFAVETSSTDEDLRDLFVFHVSKDKVQITENSSQDEFSELDLSAPVLTDPASAYGFFQDSPGAPASESLVETIAVADPVAAVPTPSKTAAAKPVSQAAMESTTIRVAVNKVDQLINLVGELVITQAMLAQNSHGLDAATYQQLLAGLADLDRNTRDLQESVMSIRMIPMSIVFSRFPRMLRDLANRLDKKVELVTLGESTELDKGLVEKITDPLTHLVRNSGDHGIEMPAERVAKGKPAHGTITLSASHQGGSIVIEVRDDGRGLSREKIMRKARERGMDVSDQMSDSEVWLLIFAPGFSTAEVITDVSGRGVGLDVVKRNIAALNGTVEVESFAGLGMKVSVRLPLTLAIMDGMSVGVGDEVYILPLSSVVESFQVNSDAVSTVAQGAQLVKVRDEYMPVIALEKIFQVPRLDQEKSSTIMVVVEAEGSRVALLVDELLGQHQVVVKNLESNYRKVPNVSGATILGDGNVALILDTGGLVRRARH
ncbi:MAG: chemotaxis protein CheW [Simplicispira sp.]|nr:chemotaxis protein CheW [Simplicispira sp.]